MKARYFAYDDNFKLLTNLSQSDITVKENGIKRNITGISCPPSKTLQKLSITLSFNTGTTMFSSEAVKSSITLAKTLSTNIVDKINLPPSEISIQSSNTTANLNLDYTDDKVNIKSAIGSLTPSESVDFIELLLDSSYGAVNISKSGLYKRIIILFSDAYGEKPSNADINSIIDSCHKYSIVFYAVVFNSKFVEPDGIRAGLTKIAEGTGGRIYNNVLTDSTVLLVSTEILSIIQNVKPCTVEWESDILCSTTIRNLALEVNNTSMRSEVDFVAPDKSRAYLDFKPSSIFFKNLPVGIQIDTTITVTAHNADFVVSDITSTNNDYTISPKKFSVKKGKSRTLTLSFTPKDSSYSFASFDVKTNLCAFNIQSSNSYFGKKSKPAIKIINPNGGDVLLAGSDTVIRWVGVDPSDTISLMFSPDLGKSWNLITNDASGLQYKWNPLPKKPSDKSLIKAKQTDRIRDSLSGNLITTLKGHSDVVYALAYSPDGDKIASGSNDGKIFIWDVSTGQIITKLTSGQVYSLAYSPDGKTLASIGSSLVIWDLASATPKFILDHYGFSVAYSPDGKSIVSGGGDAEIKIWDTSDGSLLRTLLGHTGRVLTVAYSPDNGTIASGSSDQTIKLWDFSSGVLKTTLNGHSDLVFSVNFSKDGSTLTSCSYDKKIIIWDLNDNTQIRTLLGHTFYILSVAYSPDGNTLASGCFDNSVYVWDSETAVIQDTLLGHTKPVYVVTFSPNGRIIASGSADSTIKLWKYVPKVVLQEDISDSVFSIVRPMAEILDVDFGNVLVNRNKDSLVIPFIRNIGKYALNIKSISILGPNNSEFNMISSIPPYTIQPGETKNLVFRFKPSSIGLKTSFVKIETFDSTYIIKFSGTGIQPKLKVMNNDVDFGFAEVGKSKDTILILLKNIDSIPITINNSFLTGVGMDEFEIINGGGNFTLTPNEERTLTIRFKPEYIGKVSSYLNFESSSASMTVQTRLLGQGIGGYVYCSDDSAFAGEKRYINLKVGGVKTSTVESSASSYKALIRFQKYILKSIDPNISPIFSGDSSTIEIKGAYVSADVVGKFEVMAGLGNVAETSIDLLSFKWLDRNGQEIPVQTKTRSGLFKLLGVCEEGGRRLINVDGKLELTLISPNPGDDNIEIQYQLIETGPTRMYIADVLGSNILEVFNINNISTQPQSKKISLNYFPNGLYFIILQTPTEIVTKRLLIQK
jgi:WD40 repeat protein